MAKNDLASAESALLAEIAPEHPPRNMSERRILWAWGELALAQGNQGEGLRIVEGLLLSAPSAAKPQPIPTLLNLKGRALMGLHRLDEAQQVLEEATQGAIEQGAYPLLWPIHAALGELYALLRLEEQAEREFAAARKVIGSLAATIDDISLREAFVIAALARLPREKAAPLRPISPKHVAGLTPREIEVLRLVAAGRSNRFIAEELSLSERTVEKHLTSIFTKTATDNRAGATAFAFQHGLTSS
jgi:DNA-binding CsgD family transcriptional regulator